MVIPQYAICQVLEDDALVVVLQSDVIKEQETRIVAPLALTTRYARLTRANPIMRFQDQVYMILVDQIATVPVHVLSRPLGSAHDSHDEIALALDYLFKGF